MNEYEFTITLNHAAFKMLTRAVYRYEEIDPGGSPKETELLDQIQQQFTRALLEYNFKTKSSDK